MTKVLLTSTKSSEVKGGTERFSDHLQRTFPDLKIVDYNMAKGRSLFSKMRFPPLKESIRALVVDRYLLELYEDLEPEVIFVNWIYGWYLSIKRVEAPIVNIFHGGSAPLADYSMKRNTLDYYRTRYIYAFFEKLSAKNAERVSNSEFTRAQVTKYYGLDSRVIYNAVDTHIFRPMEKDEAREMLRLPKDKKIGLYVGRPHPSKGFDIVLALADIYGDINFVCVISPTIKTRRKNVIIKSEVNQDQLTAYYSSADFLLFPSRYEGFGYVPLEALSCNTPVITSKTGIMSEIQIEGCYVIPTYDVDSYSVAIKKALDGKKVETRFYVEENFSLKRFSSSYISLVNKLRR